MKKKTGFVNLANARNEEQRVVMEQIVAESVCPFCPKSLKRFHKEPILYETPRWLATNNQWPYKNTRIHLIFILKRHAENIPELTKDEWRELGDLLVWAIEQYGVKGGGFGSRFGDIAVNGGTVRHLHAQFLVPQITDPEDPEYKPVRFRVG